MRIVLCLSDAARAARIEEQFIDEGYIVDAVDSPGAISSLLQEAEVDCVLASLSQPNCDASSLVRRLRQDGDATPVIVLADKDDPDAKVEVLDAGADDFLVNPTAFKELAARVRAMVRRCSSEEGGRLEFRDVVMDLPNRSVHRGDDTIVLTPREFALLELLMRNQGRVVTRDSITDRVWGGDLSSETSNVIDVCVSRLRRKLNMNGFSEMIRTVHGLGYALTDDRAYEGRTEPDGNMT